jgi:hypothetical protein
MMEAIRVLSGCLASAKHYEAGQIAVIPDDISFVDADLLVRAGRAEPAEVADRTDDQADAGMRKRTRSDAK